jgi:hypothetical protein
MHGGRRRATLAPHNASCALFLRRHSTTDKALCFALQALKIQHFAYTHFTNMHDGDRRFSGMGKTTIADVLLELVRRRVAANALKHGHKGITPTAAEMGINYQSLPQILAGKKNRTVLPRHLDAMCDHDKIPASELIGEMWKVALELEREEADAEARRIGRTLSKTIAKLEGAKGESYVRAESPSDEQASSSPSPAPRPRRPKS